MNIFWFRRDLRLEDNNALFEALNSEDKVLPIFIFDPNILEELPKDDPRVSFIHELITKINLDLKKHKRSLAVFHDTPENVFKHLLAAHPIKTVFVNHDYEPYARKRDLAVYQIFKKNEVAFKTFKDQVIFEKSEVVKDDNSPYVVYTPYMKRWKEIFKKTELKHYKSENGLQNISAHSYPFLALEHIGFKKSAIEIPDYDISKAMISNYEEIRNFPALDQTSNLSPHLRFGSISIRSVIRKAISEKNETFWNELIWREFFMQILWHFPHIKTKSFREKYDAVKWRDAEKDFEKWCEGKTGYPFVDAGMRQLNATGRMHNRVRMIVASFLCKHLLIDWRWGEAYFALKLLDYEQSSNVGNWQWAAGSGVDAAPYFRIFNPAAQVKKFDTDLKYIKKWIPEFETADYPEPIVEHTFARERCLKAYKNAVGN